MAKLAYRVFLFLYGSLAQCLAVFGGKPRQFVQGRKGQHRRIVQDMEAESRPRIWVHCASLGEYEQARPVLDALRQTHPHYALVLSFFSPSGFEAVKGKAAADYVYYLPLDHPRSSIAFIDTLRPELGIFVKYEFWHYYIVGMKQRGIPLVLISAYFRPGQVFFRRWGGFFRDLLHGFRSIYVQDEDSRQRLLAWGIHQVEVAGDTRFDRVLALRDQGLEVLDPIRPFLDHPRLLVAGSTWPADEKFLEELMAKLGAGWKLLIAPHQWDEKRLNRLEAQFPGAVRYSGNPSAEHLGSASVLLMDQMGWLSRLYSAGYLAWVGGGFGRTGVHNLLEAAVWSIPVAHGPQYRDFREAKELAAQGATLVTDSPNRLAEALTQWTQHPDQWAARGRKGYLYVQDGAGATQKILSGINAWLIPAGKA